MTEPSKAAIAKACELLNRHLASHWWEPEHAPSSNVITAFAGFIDKVSWAVKNADLTLESNGYHSEQPVREALSELILREPDLLAEEALRLVLEDGVARTARQQQAIKDGRAGQEKIALAYAALKRGQELAGKVQP